MPSNAPISDNGTCWSVYYEGYAIQTSYIANNGSARGVYIRSYYYGNWNIWKQVTQPIT